MTLSLNMWTLANRCLQTKKKVEEEKMSRKIRHKVKSSQDNRAKANLQLVYDAILNP